MTCPHRSNVNERFAKCELILNVKMNHVMDDLCLDCCDSYPGIGFPVSLEDSEWLQEKKANIKKVFAGEFGDEIPELEPEIPKKTILCKHLGDETRRVKCESCSGTVKIKLFNCEKLNIECSIYMPIEDAVVCQKCEHYEGGG